MTTTDAAAPARPAVLRMARRIPATLSLVVLVLAVGVASSALWQPFADGPGMDAWAYGLPALAEGRWWTPLTGTFLVAQPWIYPIVLLSFAGMAYLEARRGSRLALLYFAGGQLFAVLGAAALFWALSFTPWQWALRESAMLDVGPSGGTFACIAAAISLFVAPWRVRAWLVLIAYVVVTMLFWGSLDDVEHLLAVVLVLFVDRTLRIQRAAVREQRAIAFVALLVLAAFEVVVLLLPTDGPFGSSDPASGSFVDTAVDVVVIAVIANGLRRGRRWSWVLGIILCGVNVAVLVALVALAALSGWAATDDVVDGDPSLLLATSSMWVLMLVYLIWVRRAFRARRHTAIGGIPEPSVADVRSALHAHGGGTLSWMTTWDGNRYARTGDGLVAYQDRMGVAIALADPLGPEESRPRSVREFIQGAEGAGLVPCFFSASEATRAAVPDTWRSLVVADDTIVDLPGLQFTGKAWSAVRTSLNRAEREGVRFRMTRLKDETWGVRQQLRAISEGWVGEKGLPEMAFTLGTLNEAQDPEVRLALAMSADGDVDGFLSWLPIYGEGGVVRGWTLDLMRRREGGFAPVMEFLIGSSARTFSEEGAEILSLSGAPLTHEYPPGAGLIAELSTRLADALEPVYGFRSLHRFKEKFHPRYETMYLLYRDESDLTRIGLGLTRAFLPTATLRQFAGAGLELVRGE
jgi:lysylphosphatidylglycerol synthetase-like protein (DUF2156 family)